jgi:hypothetical protein
VSQESLGYNLQFTASKYVFEKIVLRKIFGRETCRLVETEVNSIKMNLRNSAPVQMQLAQQSKNTLGLPCGMNWGEGHTQGFGVKDGGRTLG